MKLDWDSYRKVGRGLKRFGRPNSSVWFAPTGCGWRDLGVVGLILVLCSVPAFVLLSAFFVSLPRIAVFKLPVVCRCCGTPLALSSGTSWAGQERHRFLRWPYLWIYVVADQTEDIAAIPESPRRS